MSFIQPLIAPLHGGKTASEVLAHLIIHGVQPNRPLPPGQTSADEQSSYGIVRNYWRSVFSPQSPGEQEIRDDWESQGLAAAFTGNFETWWQTSLRTGVVAGTKLPAKTADLLSHWMVPPGSPEATESGTRLPARSRDF